MVWILIALVLGVALGLMLQSARSQAEANARVALEEAQALRETVDHLRHRVENLEAIAASEPLETERDRDAREPDEPTGRSTNRPRRTRT